MGMLWIWVCVKLCASLLAYMSVIVAKSIMNPIVGRASVHTTLWVTVCKIWGGADWHTITSRLISIEVGQNRAGSNTCMGGVVSPLWSAGSRSGYTCAICCLSPCSIHAHFHTDSPVQLCIISHSWGDGALQDTSTIDCSIPKIWRWACSHAQTTAVNSKQYGKLWTYVHA